MANEKNVAALRELLFDALLTVPNREPQIMAEWLAARGVLVPSVLTDEQARAAARDEIADDAAIHLRETLERIAKGEP